MADDYFLREIHPAVVNLPMQFLGRRDTGIDHLRGLVDEVTIFNRALTAAKSSKCMPLPAARSAARSTQFHSIPNRPLHIGTAAETM